MPEIERRIEKLLSQLNDKLDILIKVISTLAGADKSMTDRARQLKLAGLDNRTIADVLNTTPNTISVLTANLRAQRKKR